MAEYTHFDASGNPTMVDVGNKPVTRRLAKARAIVELPAEVLSSFDRGDIMTVKGSVFQTAILAGIMGAKKTGELIPLCHPLGLDNCQVQIQLNNNQEVVVECTAANTGKTGVEMEALTGVSIAALTIYDMCKALSHHIVIKDVRLLEKSGGKNDFKYSAEPT